ncbi:MAG TPA: phage/plasmid primase, P4 family, partial [Ktedonobacterales bacterium]
VAIEHTAFDSKPMLFNCVNGTIELKTGKLRPHRREDLLTQQSPVAYDPNALCPTYDRFIREITLADEKPDERLPLVEYLDRAFGYGLTGETREQVWHLLVGSGENGKTTLVEAISDVEGDYAATMEPESITLQRGGGHDGSAPTPDIARLRGKRFTKVTETAEGARIDAARVKRLCGEDKLTGRHLHHEPIEFYPTQKLFVYTNHRPRTGETTHAFWRRVRLIPFDLNLQDHPERKDKKLPSKLRGEAPGILARLVRGCLAWQKDGLEPPQCVLDATKAYRSDMDIIALWLDERCELGAQNEAKASTLYADYAQWMEDGGERPWTLTRFGEALNERGFGRRSSGGTWRQGLRLKEVFRMRRKDEEGEPHGRNGLFE